MLNFDRMLVIKKTAKCFHLQKNPGVDQDEFFNFDLQKRVKGFTIEEFKNFENG